MIVCAQMDVLKAVLESYSNDLDTWLTDDQRSTALNILRDSFLCDVDDAEFQQRKDILLIIELFGGSFNLNGAAREFYFNL